MLTPPRIYKGAPDAVIDFKLRVAVHTVDESTRLTSQHTPWQMTKLLWTHKPYRRALIAVCGVQMFGQLTGFNTLLYYSSRLFGLLGLKNSAAGGLIPAGCNTLFIFIGMTLVDKVGRRGLLMRVAPGMIAGLLWAVVAFYFMTKDTGGQLVEGYTYSTMSKSIRICRKIAEISATYCFPNCEY
jgi:SP family myo-inositol transporter-like MFS transporter 13